MGMCGVCVYLKCVMLMGHEPFMCCVTAIPLLSSCMHTGKIYLSSFDILLKFIAILKTFCCCFVVQALLSLNCRWMEACIEEELPSTTELEENFQNGVFLAKLGHFFAPKVVPMKRIYDHDQSRYQVRILLWK